MLEAFIRLSLGIILFACANPSGFIKIEAIPRNIDITTIIGPIFPITSTILPRPNITVPAASIPISIPPTDKLNPYCWLIVAPAPAIITTNDIYINIIEK